jgi:TrpR-related protein YerC/YecD
MSKKDQQKEALIDAILQLQTRDEAANFIRDLLTEAEIREFSSRFRAASLLKNNVPYTQITRETGLSSTTVARVSKWLHHGKHGYMTILNRLEKSEL